MVGHYQSCKPILLWLFMEQVLIVLQITACSVTVLYISSPPRAWGQISVLTLFDRKFCQLKPVIRLKRDNQPFLYHLKCLFASVQVCSNWIETGHKVSARFGVLRYYLGWLGVWGQISVLTKTCTTACTKWTVRVPKLPSRNRKNCTDGGWTKATLSQTTKKSMLHIHFHWTPLQNSLLVRTEICPHPVKNLAYARFLTGIRKYGACT